MNRSKPLTIGFILLVIFSTMACALVSRIPGITTRRQPQGRVEVTPAPRQEVVSGLDNPEVIAAYEGALERVYALVNPSVVNIQVLVPQTLEFNPFFPEDPDLPPDHPDLEATPEAPEFFGQGDGSGFVWDQDGHIVTNYHVVEDAQNIQVTFYDGSIYTAELVGSDRDSDLAVIRVDAPRYLLQPVVMGDSSQVRVGQLAIAIGNPFGLNGTMTVGIISALNRSLPVGLIAGGYQIPDVIQTDAPINPGNSGGVLVNIEGQVIGITTAIRSTNQANAGIGFAVPSNIVLRVVPSLIESGRYAHPWLGISGTTLTPSLARAMDLPSGQRGALVIEVIEGSPSEEAGVRGSNREAEVDGFLTPIGGDVIIAIDDQPVNGMDDIIAYLSRSTEVGQTVTLTVLRNGRETTIDVTLQARPSER